MNKEKILDTLKEMVTGLMENSEKLKTDTAYQASWAKQQQDVGIAVKGLNSCDALWLNDEYAKWFNDTIKPNMPAIDPSIQDKLLWK